MARKVVIVTGGAAGIGLAIARALADEDYRVVLADVDAKKGHAALDEIGGIGRGHAYIETDVRVPSDVDHLFSSTMRRFAGLHALVNNAAVSRTLSLQDVTPEVWDEILESMPGAISCV